MSKVNIQGVVKNINFRTTIFTPLVEAIVNSIQAIEKTGKKNGEIVVVLKRSTQTSAELDEEGAAEIESVEVHDNGIGFDDKNTESFDTLYSDLKNKEGGKGIGRFMYLKYFCEVKINSVFKSEKGFSQRTFEFGQSNQLIENQVLIEKVDEKSTKTILYLNNIRDSKLKKKASTIARKILEKILIYFINDEYECPKIIIREEGKKDIVLNDLLSGNYPEIQMVGKKDFQLTKDKTTEDFHLRVFKVFFPDNQRSKISLTAHNREVTETPIHYFIPEFEENFFEKTEEGTKDFMIKSYVLGKYLDKNVSQEREAFEFGKKESDLFHLFSQEEIESKAAKITSELDVFSEDVSSRQEKKKQKISEYVESQAPWHKDYLEDLDLSKVPYNLSDEQIEIELHKAKFHQERNAKAEIKKILDDPAKQIDDSAKDLISQITKAEMSDLAHYMALRKTILNIFERSLEVNDGKYATESAVHNIIFPTRANSDTVPYQKHHLWIIDEKLNFAEFISSDEPINGGTSERTDLLVFNKKIAFRAENEASNPITIFEFKRPNRDDFTDASSEEDPVQQIIRYVNDIKDGKYKTPKGRIINIGENTPFYGFVVCTLTEKVNKWLKREKDFKQVPDGMGWFQWFGNNNLYLEVISWDKMLSDAKMRNRFFFEKLGFN